MYSDEEVVTRVRAEAVPVGGEYEQLLNAIGDARIVLIGEASHGTHEFYAHRAEITKQLITRKGFSAVAAEADWPDAYRVNRFVRGQSDDSDAVDALGDFARFPAWMWRNADVLDFVGWLRFYNEERQASMVDVGFYGLDLYSLYSSAQAVIRYLESTDTEAAQRARVRYGCFDQFSRDMHGYGYAADLGLTKSCEDEVVEQLKEMCARGLNTQSLMTDDQLFAEQNARVVRNAEHYYRAMFQGRVSSWNLRDYHMMETLQRLLKHLEMKMEHPKIVVWAHNSHLGDARATEMGDLGELNLGELVAQHYGNLGFSVGFSTYTGTVTAASTWGGEAERKRVREALVGSYEWLFHRVAIPNYLVFCRRQPLAEPLRRRRLQRAIGVLYLPQSERQSHYFHACLAEQFDAMIHLDETRAVEPLERTAAWDPRSPPDTFPSTL